MVRPPESIPEDERLFRGARAEEIEGDRLRAEAVDLQGMSCNRAKYSQARDVLTANRRYVLQITPSYLPGPLLLSNGVEWEFFALDLPLPDNSAHAEIRARRTADRPASEADKPKSPGAKLELRARRAERMRLLPLDQSAS